MKPPIWVIAAVGGVVALIFLGLVGWWILGGKHSSSTRPRDNHSTTGEVADTSPTPAPEPTAEPTQTTTQASPYPTIENTGTPGGNTVSEPAAANPDDVVKETADVRKEVLIRINAMPNLSKENKNKLTTYVAEAHTMSKLLIVKFNAGRPNFSAADKEKIRQRTLLPDFQKVIAEPTNVFVILGYADKQGDEKTNLEISQARAQIVLEVLRDKCSVFNVMHVVGMGGSDLMDANKLDRNRVVEVWAVAP